MAPLAWSAPRTLRTRKSPRAEVAAVLVDHHAEVQALVDQLDVPFGHAVLGHLEQAFEGGPAGQLVDEVALRPGHDERPARLGGSLGIRRSTARTPGPMRAPTAPVEWMAPSNASRLPPGPWAADAMPPSRGRPGRSAARSPIRSSTAKVKGSTSRIRAWGSNGSRTGHPPVLVTSSSTSVQQPDRGHRPDHPGPQRHAGRLLHLQAAADDRLGRAADEHARRQDPADGSRRRPPARRRGLG